MCPVSLVSVSPCLIVFSHPFLPPFPTLFFSLSFLSSFPHSTGVYSPLTNRFLVLLCGVKPLILRYVFLIIFRLLCLNKTQEWYGYHIFILLPHTFRKANISCLLLLRSESSIPESRVIILLYIVLVCRVLRTGWSGVRFSVILKINR